MKNNARKNLPSITLYFLLSLFIPFTYAEQVRIPIDNNDKNQLPLKLLTTALELGGKYKPTFPFGTMELLPLSTRLQGIRNGDIDIFMALSTNEYEKEFQAIYIPIYQGLMGIRLAIVKRENQDLFKHTKNLHDLKKFTAGQGTFWADTEILEASGIPLIKEYKYSNLFRMLEADRFDYYPRGAHEPWGEIEKNPELDLVVEPHIAISYNAPFYFFVKKSNKKLAEHITLQLEKLIENGAFNTLFYQDRNVKMALKNANLSSRKTIKINNPLLTSNTQRVQEKRWYDSSSSAVSTEEKIPERL